MRPFRLGPAFALPGAMMTLSRTIPASVALIASTLAFSAQAQPSPASPNNSAPASQGVAANAPSPQLTPPPFPSVYAPSTPPTLRGWQPTTGSWGGQPETPALPQRTEEVWYGWQTLLTDTAALGILLVKPELSLSTYSLGGPIVHWAHGNVGLGFASLGLRGGAPLVLGLGGLALCEASADPGKGEEDEGWECLGALAIGVLVGMATAIAVDSAALAYEKVPVEKTTLSLGPVRLMPSIATTGKQTTLSFSGAF